MNAAASMAEKRLTKGAPGGMARVVSVTRVEP